MTDSLPLIGTKLGPYEILAKLGAGGMGEVYKARDTRLDRTVAVKTLPPLVAASPEFRERFEREARVISQLSHANICALFDVGEQGGTSYLVMEHLEGETLADRLTKGPVPIAQALSWAMQIAAALNAAHRQGILHRDLKPGNIMVTPSSIKLLDFGLAKIVSGAVDGSGALSITAPPTRSTPLTAQGTILGTFQYMAPEMVEGDEADARADIWAFGCVLYEMLTGRRAFAGKSQASLFGAILKEEAPSVSATQPLASPALDRIVRTCLAKDPNQRVQSAHDLLLNLQWVAEGGSAAGVPAPVLAQRKSRDRMVWTAAALAVGAIGAATAWYAKPVPVQAGIVTRFVHTLDPAVRFTRTGRHSVAMSPDGTFFVYVANEQLFIRRMNEVDAQPIKGSEEDPVDPVVSPDGQWVAYFVPGTPTTAAPDGGTTPSLTPATLKKIPVTGGASVVLASLGFPYGLSWQDDVIVIGQGPGGVVSVPGGGGTPRQLVTLQPGEAFAASPQLIDGGRSLLFSLRKSGNSTWSQGEIVVQPAAGGERKVVVQGGHDGRVLPSGHLIYALDNSVFGARFDERSGQRTGDPVPLIVGVTTAAGAGGTGAGQFSASRDGRIAYRPTTVLGNVERRTLVWMDRQGREQPIPVDPRGYIYPRISPDGRRIALDALDVRRDIWIWDLARDILTRLTQEADTTDKRGPIWSADGGSLFYSSTIGDRAVLLRRAADGTGASDKLVEERSPQMAPSSVSPDGRTVIYFQQTSRGDYDTKALPLAGNRTPTSLLATPRVERNAEVSPDGRWLAYESNESGRNEIYVRPFPSVDAGRWQISNTGGTRPAWARNGRELFYVSADARMMAVPVSRDSDNAFTYGRPTALFSTSALYTALIGRTYDVAADGRFILVKQSAAATDNQAIVVVEHWLDEVRQRLGQ